MTSVSFLRPVIRTKLFATFSRQRSFQRNMGSNAEFLAMLKQLKTELISETHAEINALKRQQIARTFICKLSLIFM